MLLLIMRADLFSVYSKKKNKLQRHKGSAADCLLSLRVTIRGVTLGEVIFWYIFSLYATNSFICTFGVLFMVNDFLLLFTTLFQKSQVLLFFQHTVFTACYFELMLCPLKNKSMLSLQWCEVT